MILDQFARQVGDIFSSRWTEFQESSTYLQLKDRYDVLPPLGQRLVKWGSLALVLILLLAPPLSWLENASITMNDFEEKKNVTRDLLQLKRDLQLGPQVPQPPSGNELKGQVDSAIGSLGLMPEQIKESKVTTFRSEKGSSAIPQHFLQSGVQVTVSKLTIKQVVDAAFKLQGISEIVKVTGMDLKAADDDSHFYDVIFRVVTFSLPENTSDSSGDTKIRR